MSDDDTLYVYNFDSLAFSREYLDEEIPDFRAVIRDAIPLQRDPEVGFRIGGMTVTKPGLFHGGIEPLIRLFKNVMTKNGRFPMRSSKRVDIFHLPRIIQTCVALRVSKPKPGTIRITFVLTVFSTPMKDIEICFMRRY